MSEGDAVADAGGPSASFCVSRVIVTTDREAAHASRAAALAAALDGTDGMAAVYVPRRAENLAKLLSTHGAQAVLVVGAGGTSLRLSNGVEYRLHGGMGVVRLRSFEAGGADNLVDPCGRCTPLGCTPLCRDLSPSGPVAAPIPKRPPPIRRRATRSARDRPREGRGRPPLKIRSQGRVRRTLLRC